MKKEASHMETAAAITLRLLPEIGSVDLADAQRLDASAVP